MSNAADVSERQLLLEIRPQSATWQTPVSFTKSITVQDTVSAKDIRVTGQPDWLVGRPETGGNLVMQHPDAVITTRSGANLNLAPDGTGEVVVHGNLRVNGAIIGNTAVFSGEGTVSQANISSITVYHPHAKPTSRISVTLTSMPQLYTCWVSARSNGQFTLNWSPPTSANKPFTFPDPAVVSIPNHKLLR